MPPDLRSITVLHMPRICTIFTVQHPARHHPYTRVPSISQAVIAALSQQHLSNYHQQQHTRLHTCTAYILRPSSLNPPLRLTAMTLLTGFIFCFYPLLSFHSTTKTVIIAMDVARRIPSHYIIQTVTKVAYYSERPAVWFLFDMYMTSKADLITSPASYRPPRHPFPPVRPSAVRHVHRHHPARAAVLPRRRHRRAARARQTRSPS